MKYQLTQKQKEELEKIGELYRKTIYDSSIVYLPDIVKAFSDGLKEIDGDISSSIIGEVSRFHKLISSDCFIQMRKLIDGLRKILSEQLPKNILFDIVCRQKSWESVLRKILKYYFEGDSIILSDLVALRIIIDSNVSEEEQEEICHQISDICINFFTKQQMCSIMPPAKRVANNPLLKDYINHPKKNNYKSIHLAFMDENNNIFEVQIRTQEMDADAEYGQNEFEDVSEDETENELNKLDHGNYKYDEYAEIIPYIYFDPQKANRPLFRTYQRLKPKTDKKDSDELETIIVDKIGLMYAKPIEKRSRTY
ncbi:MAG: hypothetical protein HFJ40_02330 [Clostridia bacterium]|nr:hypothetical protein [Clostridia bacterium]